ncbi:hypothetical protein BX661DRAFT_168758 [Kickxella alabastrina]|uniref:uncharacterized protein n=1 Tax=Kickxella alabastrina TaxID=61397 RepID=UPI002220069A|nr:uncharacterized protein BX661DRAFT_168758 [Kickxella alabastrina]KAI7833609.1 hypothetical protein BX661DRAFT_168758 [Kickxella alabastrina]
MLSSARTFSKQVLSHRTQIQHQTKSQLRNQQHPSRPKDQQQSICHDDDLTAATTAAAAATTKHQVLEKMRLENRERKKRWRQVNEERNKDNDLRCRVTKRANQLYGAQASEAKEKWIGEEFDRRQQRRKEKEVRKRPSSPEGLMVAGEKRMKCDGRVDGILGAVSLGGFAGRPLSDNFFTTQVRNSSPPDHHYFYMPPMQSVQPMQQRHLRPWEDDDTDHPVLSRSSTLVLPPLTTGSSASPRCIDDYEMNGLSEAAFSLMTLSSAANSAGAGSSSHSSSSASLPLGHY